jgi:hypothetical protein
MQENNKIIVFQGRELKSLELSQIWVQLKLPSRDGKYNNTHFVNTHNTFRLIPSIILINRRYTQINADRAFTNPRSSAFICGSSFSRNPYNIPAIKISEVA